LNEAQEASIKPKLVIQIFLIVFVFSVGAALPFAQTPDSAADSSTPIGFATSTPNVVPSGTPSPSVTPNGTASPTPGCAAPGATASSKTARNYFTWCDPALPGVIYEQDDANNGVAYLVYNSSPDPVDVRIGAYGIVNMDDHLTSGWIKVKPRDQGDLGVLRAYDANSDWSAGVTTFAQLAP
jgi:hypothetical protein